MIHYQYIAIDVSKAELVLKTDTQTNQIPNKTRGFGRLAKILDKTENPMVVFEATGAYERKLADWLTSAEIPYAVINPRRIRAFAQSEGCLAKTDPIDSLMILRFAQCKGLQPQRPTSTARNALRDHMDRRNQITEDLTRKKNRLEKAPEAIQDWIRSHIEMLKRQLKEVESVIKEIIDADNTMSQSSAVIESVKGVGAVTSWTLLAFLPEITNINRGQLAALAGLAPYNRDSGTTQGKRYIQGGRQKVRDCLYMSAIAAATHNPHIREYYGSLRARGKPHKCAIVTAMRKILIHIQALLKKQHDALA